VKAIVPSVDVKAGIVTVTPPVGLFEELPADDVADAEASDAESPDASGDAESDAAGDTRTDV